MSATERPPADDETDASGRQRTSQQDAQRALLERDASFRALFSAIDEGYCLAEILLDASGKPVDYRFLEVNPHFEAMTGLHDAVGKTAYELVPDLEPHWVETYARVALGGEPIRFENGSEVMGRWFDVFATPVEPHGRFALVFKDITEQRRSERALRESEARFRHMADHAPVIVWMTDTGGACTFLSQSWYELTGQTPASGLGFGWLDAVHQDDRAMAEQVFGEANRTRQAFRLDYRLCTPDGQYRWAIDSARPRLSEAGEFLGYIGSVIDITDRKLIEESLRESEERYRLALMATQDAIWDWDPRTDVTVWSDTLRTIVGYSPDEARAGAAFWLEHVDPGARDALEQSLEAALASASTGWEMEYRFQRSDGSWAHLSDRGYIVRDAQGQPLRMIGAITDITEQKAAEAERNELLRREQEARADAEAAVRARDQFLSIAAHELLTPITALKGQTQLLQRAEQRGDVSSDRLRRALEALNTSLDRLTVLTRDLLDVARLRTGRMPIRLRATDLIPIVERALEAIRGQLAPHQQVSYRIDRDVGSVQADPDRLEQVLNNLLSNAAKYSPEGVEISLEARAVDGGVEVRVRDEGIGLPTGAAESIFNPFGRAANAERRAIPGMGLGLYISRQIAEQHGGRLWAESPGEGQGTTLFLWLPRGKG